MFFFPGKTGARALLAELEQESDAGGFIWERGRAAGTGENAAHFTAAGVSLIDLLQFPQVLPSRMHQLFDFAADFLFVCIANRHRQPQFFNALADR